MIYLAQPYSDRDPAVREHRFREACRVTAALVHAGHVVFSPVVHSHFLAEHGLPSTWAFWRKQDEVFLERADSLVVLMLPGWQESVGVRGEIEIARELAKPTVYLEPDLTGAPSWLALAQGAAG
jgi:hypothetical protein